MFIKSFFSFGRNLQMIVGTLLFVLILGAYYFFVFVPDNRSDVEEQRFRALQNIEVNIHEKIDNSVGMLSNLLDTYANNSDTYDSTRLNNYIKGHSKANFELQEAVRIVKKVELLALDSLQADSVCVYDFNGQELVIHLIKKHTNEQEAASWNRISLKYEIRQFIDSLLPRDFFDQYMLMIKGKIVYQTFSSGITGINPDSLHNKNKEFTKNPIREIQLSGMDYKLFLQQLKLSEDSELTIAGLLNSKRYKGEITRLPGNKSLLLLTIAIGIIFALPWIKLYQMGNQDRLTVTDGAFSFAVAMLLMSLLFFAFFKYNVLLRPDEDTKKSQLAANIERAFLAEVNKAYYKLKEFDAIKIKSPAIHDLRNLGKDSLSHGKDGPDDNLQTGSIKEINLAASGLDINQVFWLNKNGDELYNWSVQPDNAPHSNLSTRNYFSKLIDNKPFYHQLDTSCKFYLDQVLSRARGSFTSALSLPSIDKDLTAVLTFNLQSLNKPILPYGFLYAIINTQGKVLYHSYPSKNLNENLSNEFSGYRELTAAIMARSTVQFKTKYSGIEHNVYIKPLAGLPYHIVVLEDTSIKNVTDMKVFSFLTCMLLILYFFLVVEMVIFFLVSGKQSFFKKQYFDLSWIGPHKSCSEIYNLAVLWNASLIVLLTVFYFFTTFFEYLFILLSSSTAVTLFLNTLFIRQHPQLSAERQKLKKNAGIALWIMLTVVNLAALFVLESWLAFLLFEELLFILGYLYLKSAEEKWPGLKNFKLLLFRKAVKRQWAGLKNLKSFLKTNQWNFSHSFSLMVFSRLIITSGIPVALFYISAVNYETTLVARYRHDKLIKDIIAKDPIPDNAALKSMHIYEDGASINEIQVANNPLSDKGSRQRLRPTEDSIAISLFDGITRLKNTTIDGINAFHHDASDGLTVYNGLFEKKGIQTSYRLPGVNSIRVSSSDNLQYKIPTVSGKNWFKGLVYWLIFIGALLLFWLCLHRVIRKLFALNLPSDEGWEAIDQLMLTDNNLNSLLFVIGPPGSGKLEKIKDLIEHEDIVGKNKMEVIYSVKDPALNNVFIADMILIPDSEEASKTDVRWNRMKNCVMENNSLVIVNHFEYDIKNPVTNNIKLNFLEALLQRNKSKVFIISTVHPVNFLDSLNSLELNHDKEQRKPEHELERWHVLLGHFRIVIEKLETSDLDLKNKMPWERTLMLETQNSHFLNRMQQPVLTTLNGPDNKSPVEFEGDSLAFKLQVTSHYFYMYIWQSLTKEEKFLLYDLAEDGLVNPYDDYNLILLINKGLIIRPDGCLKLFNKGFRNFILTAIGNSEALKLKDQVKDNGNWSKLRVPLMILIVSVLSFLFISQQEAYSKVIAYLTILTAAVPTVLKFFTLFGSNSQKSG